MNLFSAIQDGVVEAGRKTRTIEEYSRWKKEASWGQIILPLYGVSIHHALFPSICDTALKTSKYFDHAFPIAEDLLSAAGKYGKMYGFFVDLPKLLSKLGTTALSAYQYKKNLNSFISETLNVVKVSAKLFEKGIDCVSTLGQSLEFLSTAPLKWLTSWLSTSYALLGIYRSGAKLYNQNLDDDKIFLAFCRILRNVSILLITAAPLLTGTSTVASVLLLQAIGILLVKFSYGYLKGVAPKGPTRQPTR